MGNFECFIERYKLFIVKKVFVRNASSELRMEGEVCNVCSAGANAKIEIF